MKYRSLLLLILLTGTCYFILQFTLPPNVSAPTVSVNQPKQYWFLLQRKSNKETLFLGLPGDISNSQLIKEFSVKTGRPNERPTPLPSLMGRDYWKITQKLEQSNDLETAPYFLTLDIPVSDNEPFGPSPYLECNGQCNWIVPGKFGLHGVNGNNDRLSNADPGSSGCVRHSDEDITYLYQLLDPAKEEIRYYVKDI